MNKLLVSIIVLLVAILGLGSFLAWRLLVVSPTIPQGQSNQTPTPTPTLSVSTTSGQIKKIAYIKNNDQGGNSVWIINSNGTNKEEISFMGPAVAPRHVALNWKDGNNLSYMGCDTTCWIYTYNLPSKSAILEISLSKTIDDIQPLALSWNNAGDTLAYLYRLPDGQMKLNLKKDGTDNTVKNFFAGPGRGGSLDDDVSIHFSPDDKHLLATNTLTVGNPQDKNTIWILEADTGKEVLAIPIGESGWPTQASWIENDEFIYKEGSSLKFNKVIKKSSKQDQVVKNFYNPNALSGEIYYWVNTENLPFIGAILGGRGAPWGPKKVFEGYFRPLRIDEGIIALKAVKIEVEEQISPFKSSGISIFDFENKVLELDSGEISLFAVSP